MEQPNNQYLLKSILVFQTIAVLIYTAVAMQNDGFDFFAKMIQFVSSLTWMGQFTVDFSCYLLLSALWIAWRNQFSGGSILMAITASILGIIVFAPYVLYLLAQERGDLKRVLVGAR